MAILAPSQTNQNTTIDRIVECFKVVIDERSRWGLTTGTLYGFGIITTLGNHKNHFNNIILVMRYLLGYNRIEPKRLESRLFCVCYGRKFLRKTFNSIDLKTKSANVFIIMLQKALKIYVHSYIMIITFMVSIEVYPVLINLLTENIKSMKSAISIIYAVTIFKVFILFTLSLF